LFRKFLYVIVHIFFSLGNVQEVADVVSRFKADSHIECSAHAAAMPFPCHAVPLGV
jgi:hypothetical protein